MQAAILEHPGHCGTARWQEEQVTDRICCQPNRVIGIRARPDAEYHLLAKSLGCPVLQWIRNVGADDTLNNLEKNAGKSFNLSQLRSYFFDEAFLGKQRHSGL